MRFIIIYTLASAAVLLQPTIAGVVTHMLVHRDCPNQDYDPSGILCHGDPDCTDPCFPKCVCGSSIPSSHIGSPPHSIYNCAKDVSVNIC